MADIASVLKEADKLGILNIDVNGQLSPEIIQTAIDATKRLNSKIDKKVIVQKLQKVDRIAASGQK